MGLTHIGVDMGTSKLSISFEGAVVFSQPSVVAIRKKTEEVVACGDEALHTATKEPGEIVLLFPLQEGRITDVNLAQILLSSAFKNIRTSRMLTKPKVFVSASSLSTPLAQRTLVHAVTAAGASSVQIVPTVSAVAAGVGIETKIPDGAMVVDIGAGTTDIGLVSMGEVVFALSLPLGGQAMDEAIKRVIRANYGLEISAPSAERLKIGALSNKASYLPVAGIAKGNGLPMEKEIASSEVSEAVQSITPKILEAMASVLERAGPELSGDIGGKGVVLTGGCSSIPWLKGLVSQRLGLPAFTVEDAAHTCVRGLGVLTTDQKTRTEAMVNRLVQGFRARIS